MRKDNKRSIWELAPEKKEIKMELKLPEEGLKVNLLALGDVGATLLLGLKTLGGGIIDTIGIFDVNPDVMAMYEFEMNQVGWPFGERRTPVPFCLKGFLPPPLTSPLVFAD